MSASVYVLDRGRRVKMDLLQTSSLHSVLHEYCAARGLTASGFALAFNRRVLDLSLPWKFLNLPTNAELELIESDIPVVTSLPAAPAAAASANIRVALQLARGDRVQGIVQASTTLGEVVAQFAERGELPLCISAAELRSTSFAGTSVVYLRSAVSDSALQSTTLSSLGVRAGSAISLRVSYPLLSTTANADTVLSNGKLPACGDEITTCANRSDPGDRLHSTESNDVKARAAAAAATKALIRLRAVAWDADAAVTVQTLLKLLDNVLSRPQDPRTRTIRLRNARVHSAITTVAGGLDVLLAAGFTACESADGGYLQLLPQVENVRIVLAVRRAVAAVASDLRLTLPAEPDVLLPQEATDAVDKENNRSLHDSFDPFRPRITRVADSPVVLNGNDNEGAIAADGQFRVNGKPVSAGRLLSTMSAGTGEITASAHGRTDTHNAIDGPPQVLSIPRSGMGINEVVATRIAGIDSAEWRVMTDTEKKATRVRAAAIAAQVARAPSSRNTRVVLPRKGVAEPLIIGVDSDDGIVSGAGDEAETAEEQALKRDHVLRVLARSSAAEKRGIVTAAQRDLERLNSRDARVCTTTVIRVRLPDRSEVHGAFSPLEPVAHIYSWVRALLSPLAVGQQFYLFSTPPPLELLQVDEKARQKRSDSTLENATPVRRICDANLVPAAELHFAWGSSLKSKYISDPELPKTAAGILRAEALACVVDVGDIESVGPRPLSVLLQVAVAEFDSTRGVDAAGSTGEDTSREQPRLPDESPPKTSTRGPAIALDDAKLEAMAAALLGGAHSKSLR